MFQIITILLALTIPSEGSQKRVQVPVMDTLPPTVIVLTFDEWKNGTTIELKPIELKPNEQVVAISPIHIYVAPKVEPKVMRTLSGEPTSFPLTSTGVKNIFKDSKGRLVSMGKGVEQQACLIVG